jgi:hypothetical protein
MLHFLDLHGRHSLPGLALALQPVTPIDEKPTNGLERANRDPLPARSVGDRQVRQMIPLRLLQELLAAHLNTTDIIVGYHLDLLSIDP